MFRQPSASFDGVHVLLVHPDNDILNSLIFELHSCSYTVMGVKLASEAMGIISNKTQKFDIVLAEVDLADMDVFNLLDFTVRKNVPTILMSTKGGFDEMLETKAIENGALAFFMNPITVETLRYISQYVMRDKFEKANKKPCVKWNNNLHAKFMDAVNQLGEGNCLPSKIHGVMKVSGLTVKQVSSHLQKYRNGTWQVPRKPHQKRIHQNKYGRTAGPTRVPSDITQSDVQARVGIPIANFANSNSSPTVVQNNEMNKEAEERDAPNLLMHQLNLLSQQLDDDMYPHLTYQQLLLSQPSLPSSSRTTPHGIFTTQKFQYSDIYSGNNLPNQQH